MGVGAFTGQFDLPLLLVQLFFVFFLCLVFYLRGEDKREGYPLVSDRTERTGGRVKVEGFPAMPKPKVFLQPHGRPPVYAPREEEKLDLHADRNGLDMPITPKGPAMLSGIGPGSWVPKIDEPDLSFDGDPVFQPLRALPGFYITPGDPDPRGYAVLGCDKAVAGEVVDVWVDKSEHHAMFLEVATDGRRILMPMDFASVNRRAGTVTTGAITGAQFADVPPHKAETTVTAREENQIRGYFGGGYLWAVPGRAEPCL